MLICFLFGAITLLYRFGSSRRRSRFRWIKPGALLATIPQLIASVALSCRVSPISGFGVTYGPLGAAVGIMLWFYLSAYATLLGADSKARSEHYRAVG
jgi:membrane protein